MVAVAPNGQPKLDRIPSEIPIGVDVGAGLVKLVMPDKQIRIPSKLVEVLKVEEALNSESGAHFYYHEGDFQSLVGKQFLVGSLAYDFAPTTHVKLSDDPKLKAEFALHAVLGAIGTLPHRPHWNLYLVLSSHQPDLFRSTLKSCEGKHVISFGGKENLPTRINVRVGMVLPEGAGSFAYCAGTKILDPSLHAVAIDLGTSTVIASAFNPGGKLMFREVLDAGGCIDLLEAIANDPEILKALGTGKSANVELIRQGIESKQFKYGNGTLIPDFTSIYQAHLQRWLIARMRLGKKTLAEYLDVAQRGVVWGGGAELPGVAAALSSVGWQAVPNAGWANAVGLQKIAERRLGNG